jgi:hypothetical protein
MAASSIRFATRNSRRSLRRKALQAGALPPLLEVFAQALRLRVLAGRLRHAYGFAFQVARARVREARVTKGARREAQLLQIHDDLK